jgi:hypothetical protein
MTPYGSCTFLLAAGVARPGTIKTTPTALGLILLPQSCSTTVSSDFFTLSPFV